MNRLQPYCFSLFEYRRNTTSPVKVGNIEIGGNNPIRIQSMTTTDTLDAEASAAQCMEIVDSGGELVRLTTQGKREAENLVEIKKVLLTKGYDVPLVADIHFNPIAAETAAAIAEKVRINPGNFVGGQKKFDPDAFSEETEDHAIEAIRLKLVPLLDICRTHNTALRIGVNHGSLSDRIMAKYGDTPQGMVESCMEYLRICREQNFHQIVISIKASNTRVMVHTVRLLSATMMREGMNYPLHLGVTEAGSEEEGRIKSAVGSGALLADGLGDTIRVSLTEDPTMEIPVARKLVEHIRRRGGHSPIALADIGSYHPYEYVRRKSRAVLKVGGSNQAVVLADHGNLEGFKKAHKPDLQFVAKDKIIDLKTGESYLVKEISELKEVGDDPFFLKLKYTDLSSEVLTQLKQASCVLIADSTHANVTAELRALILTLDAHQIDLPVIVSFKYDMADEELFQIASSADSGLLFLDGLVDGIMLSNRMLPLDRVVVTQFGILQASRVRFTQTDFISCPGCGRTLFDLRETTRIIKEKTGHLKGLKIGVMGCIVNGIGEMADADYGYVGAAPNKISLFKSKELVAKNLRQEEAVEALIELIKSNGDWVDPTDVNEE